MSIPTRITDEARKLARAALLYGGLDWATDSIANALNTERLAAEQRGREMEREECAEIARKMVESARAVPVDDVTVAMAKAGELIAAAIRSRKEG